MPDIQNLESASSLTLTRKVDTLGVDFDTTSSSFVDSGLTLTLSNITGGKAMVTATLSLKSDTDGGDTVVQLLKGASTVVDLQTYTGTLQNDLGVVTLFAIVDLDGQVVKVQIKRVTGTTSTIDFTSTRAIPKLEILEFSE